jgi:hypothetical protein
MSTLAPKEVNRMQSRKVIAALAAVAVAGGGVSAVAGAKSSRGSKSRAAHGHGHPGGPRPFSAAQISALADKLGVSTDTLKAALTAIRPTKPTGTRPDPGADFAAAIAKELGVDASKVKEILDANRPPRPAQRPAPGSPRPARPDDSKLISALATGLGIDEATVQTALDKVHAAHEADEQAEHAARDTAFAKALADKLGLDVDKVKAALDAVRPERPAPPATSS